jgi:predicted acylesterase/phospholipase RssA
MPSVGSLQDERVGGRGTYGGLDTIRAGMTTSPSIPPAEKRWALTLSGGGLRATLFHLGVIRRLWLGGDLGNVAAIVSVSGGSILAAHLRLNWARYTGSAEEFDAVAREILDFCGRDIRGRVVRRAILCWLTIVPIVSRLFHRLPNAVAGAAIVRRAVFDVWPSSFLLKEYERLYKRALLRQMSPALRTEHPGPELHVLATSLSTGELCAFQDNRFVVHKRHGPPADVPAENAPVALVVAASSAYPALFSPILVNASMLLAPPDRLPEAHFLSDGGLFDNLGVEELKLLAASAGDFDRVIVSDAGAAMTIDLNQQRWGFFKRAIRTTDVIMSRASDGVMAGLEGNPSFTMLRIHDTFDDLHVSLNAQMTIGAVRTDLDEFNARERNLISNHGFRVASAKLYPHVAPDGNWFPEREAYRGSLTGSAAVRWSRLLRWSDWSTWAILALTGFWLYLGAYTMAFFSGALRNSYLEHEHRQFLQVSDALGRAENGSQDTPRIEEFWEAGHPPALGSVARGLRLHKSAWVHNRVFRFFSLAPPFPAFRDRILADAPIDRVKYLHMIGDVWRADQPQRYEALRDETYLQVLRLSDELVRAATRDSRTDALIERFFTLYWGRMVALESRYQSTVPGSVETQMVNFGDALNQWKLGESAPQMLTKHRDDLRDQIFAELNVLNALK